MEKKYIFLTCHRGQLVVEQVSCHHRAHPKWRTDLAKDETQQGFQSLKCPDQVIEECVSARQSAMTSNPVGFSKVGKYFEGKKILADDDVRHPSNIGKPTEE